MAEKTTSIILTGQNDWDEWIEVIKTIAIASDIWRHVNPNTPKANLPPFEEPATPKPSDVNPQKTAFSGLDEDEKEELREKRREHKRRLDKYDKQKQALAALRIRIQETVSRANLSYTFNCESIYDMLVKLQKRFSPTDETREREVIRRYQKLKSAPQSRAIEPWLQEWEKTYDDCKRLKLPDTEGNRAVRDFIYAVDDIAEGFTNYWRNRLLESKLELDLHEIIQKFREHQAESPERRLQDSPSAYTATLQGKSLPKPCLCGDIHHFKECLYLIETNQPPDWKPDAELKQKIDEKLRGNAKLKGIIDRLRQEARDQQDKASKDVTPTEITKTITKDDTDKHYAGRF